MKTFIAIIIITALIVWAVFHLTGWSPYMWRLCTMGVIVIIPTERVLGRLIDGK